VEQVETAAALLQKAFSYVSFDILYGLNGQSTEQVLSDVRHAVALGTPTIDFYPINNLVTQQKLHRSFQAKGWLPISAIERLHMKRAIDTYMRASGFLPHNGHGYVHAPDNILADDPPITDWYRFHYHEYGYGYADHEIIGFGASAISSTRTFTATNTTRREEYIQSLLGGSLWEITLSMHKNAASEARGIIMHLPYYGVLDASRIDWATIHPDTLQALEELIDAGLVQEDSGHYTTSRAARYWYVNMMYYLMPKAEQKMLDDFISTKCQEPGRIIEDAELLQKKPFLYVDGGRL
jgi:oxygen-independent coproporphyrinogen-3 oxidase